MVYYFMKEELRKQSFERSNLIFKTKESLQNIDIFLALYLNKNKKTIL